MSPESETAKVLLTHLRQVVPDAHSSNQDEPPVAVLEALRLTLPEIATSWRLPSVGGPPGSDSRVEPLATSVAPWTHPDRNRRLDNLLKPWVYPPVASEISRKLGVHLFGDAPYRGHVLFLAPLSGPVLTLPGAIEIQAGAAVARGERAQPSARLQWNSFFNYVIGFNVIVADWVHDRESLAGDTGIRDFQVGAGITLWLGNFLGKVTPRVPGLLRHVEVRGALLGTQHRSEFGVTYRLRN